MKETSPRRYWSHSVLFLIGIIAIGSGTATALYSWLSLKPKIAAMTGELRESLELADQALTTVDKGDQLLSRSVEAMKSGGNLVALLPETFTQLKEVLQQASNTALFTGRAAKKAEEGLTGLALPDPQTEQSARALKSTARQMRELAGVVDKVGGASDVLAADIRNLSEELSGIAPRLKSDAGLLASTRQRLQGLHQAVVYFDPPTMAMLSGFGISGLYFVIGLVSLTLAFALRTPAPLRAEGEGNDERSRRVA
jgi:hypothetical protein